MTPAIVTQNGAGTQATPRPIVIDLSKPVWHCVNLTREQAQALPTTTLATLVRQCHNARWSELANVRAETDRMAALPPWSVELLRRQSWCEHYRQRAETAHSLSLWFGDLLRTRLQAGGGDGGSAA